MMRMRARTEDILPFALLLPSVIYLGLLILIPMIQALLLAVQADNGTFTTEFIDRMTGDVNFSDAWRNTLLLLVLIVPLQIVLALAMALLIHSRFKERGYLNTVGQGVGLIQTPPVYLSFENFGGLLAAIVIAESWRATAIVMVILVAGLQLIPRDYFEAADLFGANRIRRTIHVVLPLLRPSLQSALIIRTIFAFQTFAVVLALAGRNLPVIAAEAYNWYANNRNAHLAASYALLLLALTIAFTVVYLRVLGLREAEVKRA